MLAVTYGLVLRIRSGFLEGSHSLAHCTDLLSRRGNTHVGSNPTPSAITHTANMCECPVGLVWLGRLPLKEEITGSNPVQGTQKRTPSTVLN